MATPNPSPWPSFSNVADVEAALGSRVAARGRRRATTRGEMLIDIGDSSVSFCVVVSGELQVLRISPEGTEVPIVPFRAGQFSGEGNVLSGRRAVGRLRVSESGEVIELPLR